MAGDDRRDGQYSHTNESFASGLTQLERELMERQKFISQEKERRVRGTQGHTRTGDNEIRVNEGWKKPRPDGLEKLLSEMHAETRPGISMREKSIFGGAH